MKFKQAYDEAKSTIASSLDAVKVAYENINRDLADEIKTLEKEKKDLTVSLDKAKKEIEGLKSTVSNLEISLRPLRSRSSPLRGPWRYVRAPIYRVSVYVRRSSQFDRLPIRSGLARPPPLQ